MCRDDPTPPQHIAGRNMCPTPLEDHLAVELAGQALVSGEAVADQHHGAGHAAEQSHRNLGRARRVDVEVDRVGAHRGPEPGSAGAALLAKRLHAPCGLVCMAHRRLVLVREDRVCQRLEQRHEALYAVGQCARRDRQPHGGQPCRDAMERSAAHKTLEEDARPHADAVGRVVEEARLRGCRHFPRRGRAVACPAPARPDDPARVGPDLDLEDGRGTLAIGHIGLPATGADARVLRRVALFGALLEPGPLGAAMADGARLLAALASRARLLLLLALSAEQCLRKHGPARAQFAKLGFQRLDARCQRRPLGLRSPRLGAQTGVPLAQRHDHVRGPHGRRPQPIVPLT